MVRLLAKVIDRCFGEQIELQCLTDSAKARETIENDLIGILLTDLEMPGTNGLSLLRCAKRRNALTQVLFITGHSSLEALSDALELDATDYLPQALGPGRTCGNPRTAQKRLRRWQEALAGTFHTREDRVPAAAR